MKNIKLNIATAVFAIFLSCSAAFADGDQGSGGFVSTDAPAVKTSDWSLEGDQGSGGRAASTTSGSYIDTFVISVSEYFDWLV